MSIKNIFIFFLTLCLWVFACKTDRCGNRRDVRTEIITEAQKHLGTPYCSGGKTPKKCFDCSGFTQFVFQKFGIQLPSTATDQFKSGKNISKHMAKPGDLIFFKGVDKKSKVAGHVGIVIETPEKDIVFIHASTTKGIMKSKLSEPYFGERFLGVKSVLP